MKIELFQETGCQHSTPCLEIWMDTKIIGSAGYDKKQDLYCADFTINGKHKFLRHPNSHGLQKRIEKWINRQCD